MSDVRDGAEPRPGEPEHPDEPPAGLADATLLDRSEIGVGRDGRRLGWLEFVVGAVVYVSVQLVAGVVIQTAYGRLPGAPGLLAISAAAAFVAVGVALSLRVRIPSAIGIRRVAPRTVAYAVGLGISVWLLSRLLIIVYVTVTGDHSDPQQDLTRFSGPTAAFFAVLLGGLVVPLGEELLFRGVGYGSMRRYGRVVATVVASLVFALAHGLNVAFLAVLVLAVLNAVLYERTHSIWPCVATHATFNLCSFAVLLAIT
ncbi:CPBP family intramembrane metalloprotease [Actinomycetospora endophytica]|uniref:CPBP family intramembrane metalloprotease n=1 Tax=Actinomycetospora endophytica TaxID=2291215 RepID=A0ABS8P986_9PSEU|nr:CPBP family intramembrane glutamic endopeptidase [Actinomycetospora endophytica]MCD2193931.1 CPBP family intramembrane metalloprotease [Actinomycetospora endophytica]